MPVWWYPFSSIRWSPASTRVALVGALGLGRASAWACSAMCDLLRRNNRPVDYDCQVVESNIQSVIALLYLSTSFLWWQAVAGIIGSKSRNGEQGDAGDYAAEDIWLFRSLVAASIHGHSRPIPGFAPKVPLAPKSESLHQKSGCSFQE